ncbi:AsmA family protein, partial [Rhodospirillum rubrum]
MVRGGTILKVVFGLAVVLVVAVVVLVATFDLNAYKGRLAAELGRLTGREVTIAGDIGLALSLTPTIAVEGVTLGNAAWAGSEPMVAVDRLEAKIAVVPLLSGIVSIDSLELDAPRILLATNAAGQGNWALTPAAKPAAQTPPAASKSEPTPEPTPDPAAAQSTAAAPVSFDIRSVTITDALLTYKDGKAGGPPTTLTLKSLTLLSEGAGQPLDVDLQGALGARLLGLSGKLGAIDTILAGQPMAVDLAFETDGLSGTVKGSVAEPLKGKGLDLAVVARAADLSDLAGNSVAALPLDLSTRITQDGAAYRLGDLALRLGASSVSGALRIDPAAKPLAVTGVLAAPLLDLAELLPKRPALSGGGGGAGAPGTSS